MEGERIREDTPSQHLTKSSMELRESAKHYFPVCVCVSVCVCVLCADISLDDLT